MLVDLAYVHVPCPKCGEKLPLKAWFVECDYDEDGHAHGVEVETLECCKCGRLEESDSLPLEQLDSLIERIEEAYWKREMVEVGSILDWWPGLFEKGERPRASRFLGRDRDVCGRPFDRQTEITNLIAAIHLDLHRDPRWWAAARRLWPDLQGPEDVDVTEAPVA